MSDHKMDKNKTFTLFDNENGNSYEIPIIEGSLGPNVLDIRNLYKDTGLFTYDPGFTSTASCKSKITYIDGEQGILRHRGYNIEELANKSDFIELRMKDIKCKDVDEEMEVRKILFEYHWRI